MPGAKQADDIRGDPVTVRRMRLDGWGVSGAGNRQLRVDSAIEGERLTFVRKRRRRGHIEGIIGELIDPSPHRIEPVCPYFGVCGGCALQHVSADHQLALKQDWLLEELGKYGLKPARVLEPVSGPIQGYRRRARLGVRYVDGKKRVLVGFRERFKPYVTDMQSCAVLVPEASDLIAPLAELVGGLSIYNRLPQVEVTVADNQIALVLRVLSAPSETDLDALANFEREKAVTLYLQPGGPDSVIPVSPPAVPLRVTLPISGQTLELGPTDFLQVNSDINQKMISLSLELLEPDISEKALDLFCGNGNITLPLAERVAEVIGIEENPRAVEQAAQNARLNGLNNVTFCRSDLAHGLEPSLKDGSQFALAVLDPPRMGAERVVSDLGVLRARRIVYISCHGPSLARDAGILTGDHGYRLEAVCIMDMFPHTSHVESLALFVRR